MTRVIDVPWVLDRMGVAMETTDTTELSLLPACELYVAQVGAMLRFHVLSRVLDADQIGKLITIARSLGATLFMGPAKHDIKDEQGFPVRTIEVTITLGPVRVEREKVSKSS